MIKKLLPVILLLVGTGGGVGAGLFLRPAPTEPELSEHSEEAEHASEENHADEPDEEKEYIKLSNQFVIPIVKGEKVIGLVVMALSLEVPFGQKEVVAAHEPKLRDSFLQVLFDHANIGGFDGAFTNANNLSVLRQSLREVAQRDLGEDVAKDVLILEIARQDY